MESIRRPTQSRKIGFLLLSLEYSSKVSILYYKQTNMKVQIISKTMTTVCGKQITYIQRVGENAKPHSLEGPAIVYSDAEGLAPEYYIYGIRYNKAGWLALVAHDKVLSAVEPTNFDY